MKKGFWLLLILGMAAPVWSRASSCEDSLSAADRQAVDRLFSEAYFSIYQENRCGENVLKFIELAESRGVSLESGYILHFRNSGGTELDSIWGLRPRGRDGRWAFFHVALEYEGVVYDFDYTKQPTPRALKDYLFEMFFDESRYPTPRPAFFPNPRKEYVVRRIPVKRYLDQKAGVDTVDEEPAEQLLGEFLEKYPTCEE